MTGRMLTFLRALRQAGRWAGMGGVLAIGVVLGIAIHWGFSPAPTPSTQVAAAPAKAAELWVCAMNYSHHPYYSSDKPGKCGYCKMPLTLAATGSDPQAPLTLSEGARRRLGILTRKVERKLVAAEVRMSGEVDYDETALGYITAWVGGRIIQLFADSTGVPVRQGDHMVELYSPELLSAQEEFLGALKAVRDLAGSDVGIVREMADATVTAASEKLRLLGLSAEQVAAVVKRGKAADRVTINTPVGGIVISIDAKQGGYVKTGTRIYTIADVSKVWAKFDAFESDLQWLRYGQEVTFTTTSLPGREFTGRISLIAPVLNRRKRTVEIRVNAPNPDGALKPGMFAEAVVRSQIAAGGRVIDPAMAGKWICHMHPGVIKDKPGKCDVCGMPLTSADQLGYVDAAEAAKPLVVPVSAVLQTGRRAVVYVRVPDAEKPTYEIRPVKLGPRAGDYYLVAGGLFEGEEVVVKGNFRIDSERQLLNSASLMGAHELTVRRSAATGPASAPATGAFAGPDGRMLKAYFALGDALAGDDFPAASAAAGRLGDAVAKLPAGRRGDLPAVARGASAAKDITALRAEFALLSELAPAVAGRLPAGSSPVYQLRCPMAFNNRGAAWLQAGRQVRNPYFGAGMLRCGSIVQTLRAPAPAGEHDHE